MSYKATRWVQRHDALYRVTLYRTRKFLGKETLSLIYYSLIYSRVQYGIAIWSSAKKNSPTRFLNTTQ